jgi:uncharacterized FlaG/YvyC family protein
MAINLNQAFVGQPVRVASPSETVARQRGSPSGEAAPVAESEATTRANRIADVTTAAAPESTMQALTAPEVDSADVVRAVEQANRISAVALRATNRSVKFARHDTGRVTITIREDVNGEEVVREIPPSQFLKVVERLKAFNGGESGPRGALLDVAT